MTARQEVTSAADLPPVLFSLREIASHLGVSRATIRRLVTAGGIPFFRVGSQLRFDPVAVRARLEQHR